MNPLARVAEVAALIQYRHAGWLSLTELRGEAWVAVLEAERTWRSDGGAPLQAYCYRAAVNALYAFVSQARLPVSVGSRSSLPKARGMTKIEVHDGLGLVTPSTPEADLGDMEWGFLVRRALKRAVANLDLAERVLAGGERPAEVAKLLGVPASRVYQEAQTARRRLRSDPELRQLWLANRK